MASTCGGSQATTINNITAEEGICPGGDKEEDWENLNDKDRPEQIENALKHLGNVKRRKMATFILKDLIGDEGHDAVKGIKKGHDKLLKREKRSIKRIHTAVDYFEGKMKIRREELAIRSVQSASNTYKRHDEVWRNEWNMMNETNSDLPSETFLYNYLFDK